MKPLIISNLNLNKRYMAHREITPALVEQLVTEIQTYQPSKDRVNVSIGSHNDAMGNFPVIEISADFHDQQLAEESFAAGGETIDFLKLHSKMNRCGEAVDKFASSLSWREI